MLKNRKESSLHRALKFQYSGEGGDTEAITGTYVCDGRTRKGELIEVQTNSFGPLKEKVKALCKKNKVRIIHPIIIKKTLELYDVDGRLIRKRKSPAKGCTHDLFKALIYAPELPLSKNLTIELALIDVIEKRIDDGSGSWRRKGVRIADKVLSAWHGSVILKKVKDYIKFAPFKKNECFTVKNLAEKARINADLSLKTIYTLTKMGILERVGKQGRAYVYKIGALS